MVVDWVLQRHASSRSVSSKEGNRDKEQNVNLFICLVVLFFFCFVCLSVLFCYLLKC